jgi:hypothetical protein
VPSLSVALRMLLLVRTTAAMYSIISDCDEGELASFVRMFAADTEDSVFNFYEPLHYFQHNEGFQTWELSPQFAIRSWSYVLLHWPLAHLVPKILHLGKVSQVRHSIYWKAFLPLGVEATILRLENLPWFHLFLVRVKVLPRSGRDCQ